MQKDLKEGFSYSQEEGHWVSCSSLGCPKIHSTTANMAVEVATTSLLQIQCSKY